MTQHDEYVKYLMGRSRIGHLYGQHVPYPRLVRHLRGRMLDVGCGIGDMLAFRPNSVGVDINEHTVAYCRQRSLDAHVMEPDRLPFAQARFDSVLLDNVLEHLPEPVPLLEEVLRVLVAQGRLLIGVPGQRGWDSDPDHKVRYDESSLVACVTACGFQLAALFHTPLCRSDLLSRYVRQYCIYGAFDRA
jgi:SAM-dependent methyltransferase